MERASGAGATHAVARKTHKQENVRSRPSVDVGRTNKSFKRVCSQYTTFPPFFPAWFSLFPYVLMIELILTSLGLPLVGFYNATF